MANPAEIQIRGTSGYDRNVLAVIFHFWLGVILFVSGCLVALMLIGFYVKTVTAAKYPHGKQKRED